MEWLINKVHVNIPFTMLYESYLERFVEHSLNPEIGLDATALERYSLSDYSGIADKLRKRGLAVTLHGPFMDLSPGSPDPKVREVAKGRFKQMLRLVPLFRPRSVVCHTGYDNKRYSHMRDEWIDNSLELWSWLSGRLQVEDVPLMLENVYEHHPDEIRILLENLRNQGAGFCLDPGHLAVFGRASLEAWVESLGPYLRQLHLHDNRGRQDEHLALGKGRINYGKFFKEIKAIRSVPPIITLEPHREEELWPSLEYLEKIWPW